MGRALVVALTVGALAPAPAFGYRATAGHRMLVDYIRDGGLAGRTDHLVVTEDGHARLTTYFGTRRGRLDRATRTRLVQALRRAGFAHLKPIYEPPPGTADYFTYTVSHNGHTVRTADGVVPPRLQPVINILDGVIDDLGG